MLLLLLVTFWSILVAFDRFRKSDLSKMKDLRWPLVGNLFPKHLVLSELGVSTVLISHSPLSRGKNKREQFEQRYVST